MRFNMPTCRAQTARIAQLLGCDVDGLAEEEAAEQAIEAVRRLAREIGIPQRLLELGLTADQIPTVAGKAFQAKRILRVNPREISQQEMEQILRAAQ
jgi:alcohol dehydrogenase class IV